jgi:hypothetical protein
VPTVQPKIVVKAVNAPFGWKPKATNTPFGVVGSNELRLFTAASGAELSLPYGYSVQEM